MPSCFLRLPSWAVCLSATTCWFAFLVLMNGYHLGPDAALHWDASTCIVTADPMPTPAQLADARGHVFDLARESHSDDPAVVTAHFQSPAALGRHGPLEMVRRYYSQVSYALARAAFNAGGRLTGSPTGGVVAFQLAAAVAIAIGLGLLTTFAIATAGSRPQMGMAALAFLAVAGTPVFLSIARQVLTETVGWLFLVPGLLLAARRERWSAAAAGACLFLAVRSRYNLGPAIAALLPLVWLLTARPSPARLLIAFATVALCAAADVAVYGPMLMPWTYDDALVRSTRLYFHTDPPYDPFWVAAYVNGPLLLLPPLGVACWWIGRPSRPWPAAYATAVLLLSVIPIVAMARQQVSYQPRHLFAFSGLFAIVLLLTVSRIRWRPWTAMPFAAACLLATGMNVYSTVGPQRTTMRVPWPPTIAQTLRHRWTTLGPHEPWPLVLLDGYFDWSDNRRVHDPLLALRAARRTPGRPLLVVSGGVDGSGACCRWAKQFGQPVLWWPPAGVGDERAVDAALAEGRPVLAVLPPGGTLPNHSLTPIDVGLDLAVIARVGR